MKSTIAKRSIAQGFSSSRLPTFSPAEKVMLKGSFDFIAVNTYTSSIVKAVPTPDVSKTEWDWDAEVFGYQPGTWESTGVSFMKVRGDNMKMVDIMILQLKELLTQLLDLLQIHNLIQQNCQMVNGMENLYSQVFWNNSHRFSSSTML